MHMTVSKGNKLSDLGRERVKLMQFQYVCNLNGDDHFPNMILELSNIHIMQVTSFNPDEFLVTKSYP